MPHIGSLVAPKAEGQAHGLPMGSAIDRPAEAGRVNKGFGQYHGMAVDRLPVASQATQRQAEDAGSPIGDMRVGQDKKPRIVGHKPQAPPALLQRPANPGVPSAAPIGGSRPSE